MKKYLISQKGNFYKANLHCHSTLSDGKFTVEELKEAYKQNGYSILATSDHDASHCNYNLSDKDFLILTAYEISIRSDDDVTPHALKKVVDLNLFAEEPLNIIQVGYHPDSVEWLVERGKMTKEEQASIKYVGELRDMHYYPANINKIISSANENGFLVCINHPMWSLMNYNDYGCFEGAWAVEVYNHSCYAMSGLSDSEQVYDDILRSGKKIFALATDDNHSDADRFGGFTMIKSQNLDYKSVIEAMKKGDFYASTGPEIYELYYEDGKVHIECSPAADICMTTLGRLGKRIAAKDGESITSADFVINKDLFGFVRFRVTDRSGHKAYTNPYYIDEFVDGAIKKRFIR